jgi:hypothetical protein
MRSLIVPPPIAVKKAKKSIPKKSKLDLPPILAPVIANTKVPIKSIVIRTSWIFM